MTNTIICTDCMFSRPLMLTLTIYNNLAPLIYIWEAANEESWNLIFELDLTSVDYFSSISNTEEFITTFMRNKTSVSAKSSSDIFLNNTASMSFHMEDSN